MGRNIKYLSFFVLLSLFSSCLFQETKDNYSLPLKIRPLSKPALSYLQNRYGSLFQKWYILGPFPSPFNPLERDLLINSGGENKTQPSSKAVIIPPRTKIFWNPVRPLDRDFWIPEALLTRYTGYVPIHSGKPERGAETAIAFSEIPSKGGFNRILFKPWGSAKLLLNGIPLINRVDFHNFFGQREAFADLKKGVNKFLVKIENITYNSTAQAEFVYGSWGFYLDVQPAGKINDNFFIDLPFIEDVTSNDTSLLGKLAVRHQKKQKEIINKSFLLKLSCGKASTELYITPQTEDETGFYPFLLDSQETFSKPRNLVVTRGTKELLRIPIKPRRTEDVILMRTIYSPSDGSLQPYLLYVPPGNANSPLIVYLHGGATTEEELACWPSGLIEFARNNNTPILSPRAREGDLLSDQAIEDIMLSFKEAKKYLKLNDKTALLAGSGKGAICALKLASCFPYLFKAVVITPKNPYEKTDLDFSPFQGILSNFKTTAFVLETSESNLSAQLIIERLKSKKIPVKEITIKDESVPFSGSKTQDTLTELLQLKPLKSPAYGNKGLRCQSPMISLGKILNRPHACVIPNGPKWFQIIKQLLAKSKNQARFGRNVGNWNFNIIPVNCYRESFDEDLILFGNPAENIVEKKILRALSIKFSNTELVIGEKRFPLATDVVLMVFQDPFNPKKLVAVIAGDQLKFFAETMTNKGLNPFSNPENKTGTYAWRLNMETGIFREVFNTPRSTTNTIDEKKNP